MKDSLNCTLRTIVTRALIVLLLLHMNLAHLTRCKTLLIIENIIAEAFEKSKNLPGLATDDFLWQSDVLPTHLKNCSNLSLVW